jgi:hypothetical protein
MAQAISTHHPAVVLRSRYRQLRALLAVAMIAVVGLSAAVVVLALDDDGATTTRSVSEVSTPSTIAAQPSTRPDESAVAASIGSQPAAVRPDESGIAAAIGTGGNGPAQTAHPDESSVAAAIASGSDQPTGPDESNVASAISGR